MRSSFDRTKRNNQQSGVLVSQFTVANIIILLLFFFRSFFSHYVVLCICSYLGRPSIYIHTTLTAENDALFETLNEH